MKKIKKSTDRSTEKSLSGSVQRARSKTSFRRANPLDLMHADFDATGEGKQFVIDNVGSCGNFSSCPLNVRVACYSCRNYLF